MGDPLLLYPPDGKKPKFIPAIDAPGWIAKGWSLNPPTPASEPEPAPKPEPRRRRLETADIRTPENES